MKTIQTQVLRLAILMGVFAPHTSDAVGEFNITFSHYTNNEAYTRKDAAPIDFTSLSENDWVNGHWIIVTNSALGLSDHPLLNNATVANVCGVFGMSYPMTTNSVLFLNMDISLDTNCGARLRLPGSTGGNIDVEFYGSLNYGNAFLAMGGIFYTTFQYTASSPVHIQIRADMRTQLFDCRIDQSVLADRISFAAMVNTNVDPPLLFNSATITLGDCLAGAQGRHGLSAIDNISVSVVEEPSFISFTATDDTLIARAGVVATNLSYRVESSGCPSNGVWDIQGIYAPTSDTLSIVLPTTNSIQLIRIITDN